MAADKKQATPPPTQPYGAEAFGKRAGTVLRWLGNSGLHINCRGSNIMVDPVLEDFDMPLLIDMPLSSKDIPQLDSVLITHSDNDHFSNSFFENTRGRVGSYHAPHYVKDLIKERFDIEASGHDIRSGFSLGDIQVTLTPADHAWQNERKKYDCIFQFEDFCGFWIETPDGKIWVPGDSRFLPDFMELDDPDVIFFDFCNDSWHIGTENAIKLANHYPKADLILQHWGTVDSDWAVFNGDPAVLEGRIDNPERVHILAAGQPFELRKKWERDRNR